MVATQYIKACRLSQDNLLKLKPSIRMKKKGVVSNFECGMVVGAGRAGFSISGPADLLEFSPTTISRVYKEWPERENIQWVAVVLTKNALLMSEDNG